MRQFQIYRRRISMPALLPVFLLGSQIVLAADAIPKLDIGPTCRSAGATAIMGRSEEACKQDEITARDVLQQKWRDFQPADQLHCSGLSALGGSQSYVELLTCLEIAKAANEIPESDRLGDAKPRKAPDTK